MIKHLMLRVKSQKQYNKTLADLRGAGVAVEGLSGYVRLLTHHPDQIVISYTIPSKFCSDGVATESDLSTDDTQLSTSRKEFIAAIKAQRSGESK